MSSWFSWSTSSTEDARIDLPVDVERDPEFSSQSQPLLRHESASPASTSSGYTSPSVVPYSSAQIPIHKDFLSSTETENVSLADSDGARGLGPDKAGLRESVTLCHRRTSSVPFSQSPTKESGLQMKISRVNSTTSRRDASGSSSDLSWLYSQQSHPWGSLNALDELESVEVSGGQRMQQQIGGNVPTPRKLGAKKAIPISKQADDVLECPETPPASPASLLSESVSAQSYVENHPTVGEALSFVRELGIEPHPKSPSKLETMRGLRDSLGKEEAVETVAAHMEEIWECLQSLLILRDKNLSLSDRRNIAAFLTCVKWRRSVDQCVVFWTYLGLPSHVCRDLKDLVTSSTDPVLFGVHIPEEHRFAVLWDALILILGQGCYDAHDRVALQAIAHSFQIPWESMAAAEDVVGRHIGICATIVVDGTDDELLFHDSKGDGRWWKIGLAALVGGGMLLVSGSLAAPFLLPAFGGLMTHISVAASALGVASVASVSTAGGSMAAAGGVTMVAGIFGLTGASVAGYKVAKRTAGVEDFAFQKIVPQLRDDCGGMHVTLWVPGWLTDGDMLEVDGSQSDALWGPIIDQSPYGEHYSVLWERKHLLEWGDALQSFLTSKMATEAARYYATHVGTTLAAAAAAVQWPITLLGITGMMIDNPWSLVMDRAAKCGRLLARVIMLGMFGRRPMSFGGFSVGAAMIFYCLEELAENRAFGLVENVYLLGCPVTADVGRWGKVRSIVAGHLVNGFCQTDWVLSYLFRTTNLTSSVAGLYGVTGVDGVENIDLSSDLSGHIFYRKALVPLMAKVMREPPELSLGDLSPPQSDHSLFQKRSGLQKSLDSATTEIGSYMSSPRGEKVKRQLTFDSYSLKNSKSSPALQSMHLQSMQLSSIAERKQKSLALRLHREEIFKTGSMEKKEKLLSMKTKSMYNMQNSAGAAQEVGEETDRGQKVWTVDGLSPQYTARLGEVETRKCLSGSTNQDVDCEEDAHKLEDVEEINGLPGGNEEESRADNSREEHVTVMNPTATPPPPPRRTPFKARRMTEDGDTFPIPTQTSRNGVDYSMELFW